MRNNIVHIGAGDGQATRGEPAKRNKRPPRKADRRRSDGAGEKKTTGTAEKRADPNSPFAALAALKARLEGEDSGS